MEMGADVTSANVPSEEGRQDRLVSLYPELDEALLTRFVEALELGDTRGLAPLRAAEVTAARHQLAFSRVKMPGADGEPQLDGALWKHPTGPPRPLIVMPSPWTNVGWWIYAVQATLFALEGYNVLAYTTRGFGQSEGEVEVAGPEDIADGSRALGYLIEQSGGAFTKAGFLGDSYGSGVSQLVAAHDERVSAVVAMSTWGDLGEAFYENSTRHTAAVQGLFNAAKNARLSERTQEIFDDVLAGRNIPETLEWARERSPYTCVDRLNSRSIPVYFAHAWHETLFPNNQTLKMFNALSGPKRIILSIGDHSGPETPGTIGLPNRIWEDAHRWFAHQPQRGGQRHRRRGTGVRTPDVERPPDRRRDLGRLHRPLRAAVPDRRGRGYGRRRTTPPWPSKAISTTWTGRRSRRRSVRSHGPGGGSTNAMPTAPICRSCSRRRPTPTAQPKTPTCSRAVIAPYGRFKKPASPHDPRLSHPFSPFHPLRTRRCPTPLPFPSMPPTPSLPAGRSGTTTSPPATASWSSGAAWMATSTATT